MTYRTYTLCLVAFSLLISFEVAGEDSFKLGSFTSYSAGNIFDQEKAALRKDGNALIWLDRRYDAANDETVTIYSEVEVIFNDKTAIELFSELGLDLDHFHPELGVNRVLLPQEELKILRDNRIPFEVIIDDVASAIERRNIEYLAKNPLTEDEKTTAGFELGGMGGFYTYAEVLAQLDEMKTLYPDLITDKFSIGTTSEGRTIWAVKISDNPDVDESAAEAPVYFDALHHAREPASMATVINYMFHLLENYSTDPGLEYIIENREIFVVPVVNPDGYEYNRRTNPNGGGLWRKNRRINSGSSCRGVDINRNYDTDWAGASSSNPCANDYHGTAPFSEPEAQAIRNFTTSIGASIAYTTHTSGGYWLGPDFSNNRPDFAIHAELMNDCMQENEYIHGDADVILGYVSGTTQGWLYEALGTLTWTPEIGTTGFWPTVPEIIPLVNQQIKPYTYACWVAGALADYQGFDVTSGQGLSSGAPLDLDIVIKNKGLSRTAQNVSVAVSTDNAGVTALAGVQSYGNIASRGSATNTSSFTFTVNPSVPVGTVVKFYAEVSQEGVVSDLDSFNLTVGVPTVLFSDDAESGSGAWTNGGSGSTWEASSEDAYTGNSCFVDSRISHAAGNRSFSTVSGISLAGTDNPRLEFAAKWSMYQKYTRLQISVNGGGWANLSTSAMETVNGGPGFVGNERWTYQVADLGAYGGQSVRFRFANFGGGTNPDGFYFDDFRVVDYAATDQASCTDGIQNGAETDVDCGGPDCQPCIVACVPVTLFSDDFEAGYGAWNDGGSDCSRVSSATYANSGTISARLRDNSSSSVMTTDLFNPSAYSELSVDFTYVPVSMDNPTEDFWLQISTNGGASYTTVEEWNRGDEFENNIRYFEQVTIPGPFTTNTRLRFRCDASGNSDWIYLDDIIVTGCNSGTVDPTCTDGIRNGGETGIDCGGPDCAACPTCSDGVQNGNETGVDCGGPDCNACAITYCSSSASTQYEYIQSVNIGGVANTSGNNNGYADFTGNQAFDLSGTTSVSLTPGFIGGTYNEFWQVYVDFNADGDFSDSGELVFQGAGTGVTNGSFNVPGGLAGTSRMRIQMQYNAYGSSSCGSYAWGEVEDYTVNFGDGSTIRGVAFDSFSITAPSHTEMELFPNPAHADITVRISLRDQDSESSWFITDAGGRVVVKGEAAGNTLRGGQPIDIRKLTAGVYFFSLNTSEGRMMRRFIVKY